MTIGPLKTKGFLSAILTKIELTEYLSKKLNDALTLDFEVVYSNCCLTNISSFNRELFGYNQEEAITGIVLHALDVSKSDPLTELVISSSDTDVLLILLNYFEDINGCTIYKTFHHEYYLREIHESLKTGIIKALLGFHAFSGCDQTGKFHGYGRKSCWQTFLRSSGNVLDAFGRLGNDESSSDADLIKFKKFVLNLYCKNSVPSSATTFADLGWQMFSKNKTILKVFHTFLLH